VLSVTARSKKTDFWHAEQAALSSNGINIEPLGNDSSNALKKEADQRLGDMRHLLMRRSQEAMRVSYDPQRDISRPVPSRLWNNNGLQQTISCTKYWGLSVLLVCAPPSTAQASSLVAVNLCAV
jgi:hypothetical protein